MIEPKGTMSPPVHLPSPYDLNADPAPGCGVCAALDKQRQEARERGKLADAAVAGVEIANHPHKGRRPTS
ncbi:hypothetical protein ACIPXV_19115 [Streptomyces libani]|uniref:hypothetical protein n=1 Tax=Streptomyces TaxID=1883 RepID=UPI000F8D08FB|nr:MULTISPECIES: hypothetical protein [Streptomyces]QIK04683.1 hypothetical protein G7Z12_05490 [Streptomyces sp. ID38640]